MTLSDLLGIRIVNRNNRNHKKSKFLSSMAPNWNISLFHYRNQGADYSSILVGMQVPVAKHGVLDRFLATLGYPHREETHNPAYRLFLS